MSKQQVKEPFNEVFISFLGENGFQPSMFGISTYIDLDNFTIAVLRTRVSYSNIRIIENSNIFQ